MMPAEVRSEQNRARSLGRTARRATTSCMADQNDVIHQWNRTTATSQGVATIESYFVGGKPEMKASPTRRRAASARKREPDDRLPEKRKQQKITPTAHQDDCCCCYYCCCALSGGDDRNVAMTTPFLRRFVV